MNTQTDNSSPITREIALKIGLAARALPDTDPRRLMAVLISCIGLPITEEKLATLKVKDLKAAADGELSEMNQDALKNAVQILKGETGEPKNELPTVQAYQEGDMPNSIRVACASNTGETLDGHFGSCNRFLIYQVSKDEIRLVDLRSTTPTEEVDDKNAFRAELISDCHVMYVASIGGPAAAKVVKAGIHPIKAPEGGDILTALHELKVVLASAPPPWLAKVMGVSPEERKRFMLELEE
ncbi:dinitrogenase iron-molybdenum cofactor biosynthesis protein [Beggiatoa leptomitoformis]|uniref:Dinitrogenase iron-molybdenum cofactor biosynthesis protein n=1 Tax=Beggiatoa leptomitoformis TaxID=288004 RepID=A0A2N9YB03_9GAMM|nr:dinitrogenase iron-molybdenum cofactor biosynthesis protein [Beggiatoa leptomitoformis]ALG66998.1 dinitrogenase iron-molybdenum cofactor biosynthesis protein [Beggiatoa leptomitoformis]AUI67631.1 dinitrogenase iron-molybdenum cofactor biosynthesis protein [Beggiatoa leptomitoformis]